MLQNRIYLGETVHKDKSYPGEHERIVDRQLWDAVQAKLMENRIERPNGGATSDPSLLVGLLLDDQGNRMTPSHAVKNGKRYSYYVSRPLVIGSRSAAPDDRRKGRVPARRHRPEPQKACQSHNRTTATAHDGLINAKKHHPTSPLTRNRLSKSRRKPKCPLLPIADIKISPNSELFNTLSHKETLAIW